MSSRLRDDGIAAGSAPRQAASTAAQGRHTDSSDEISTSEAAHRYDSVTTLVRQAHGKSDWACTSANTPTMNPINSSSE
jgi:hypothetical protein